MIFGKLRSNLQNYFYPDMSKLWGTMCITALFFVWNSSAQSSAGHDHLNKSILKDIKEIKSSNHSLNHISDSTLVDLFFEGIAQSMHFLESMKPYEKRVYKRLIKKVSRQYKNHGNLHRISKVKDRFTIVKNVATGHQIFQRFSGKWYGFWKFDPVHHHWLSPKFMPPETILRSSPIALNTFQTVSIGDGIGWNYQISYRGKRYILGYVVHLNDMGTISMKRPHIGFYQDHTSIIWLTKDHIYFEFICHSDKHANLPLHYVISAAHYERTPRSGIKIKEIFQEIYTNSAFIMPHPSYQVDAYNYVKATHLDWISLFKE